jgi:hypothetical protein
MRRYAFVGGTPVVTGAASVSDVSGVARRAPDATRCVLINPCRLMQKES